MDSVETSCYPVTNLLSFRKHVMQLNMYTEWGEDQVLMKCGKDQVLWEWREDQALSKWGEDQALWEWGEDQVLSKWEDDQTVSKWGEDQAFSKWGEDQALSKWGEDQALSKWGEDQALLVYKLTNTDKVIENNILQYMKNNFLNMCHWRDIRRLSLDDSLSCQGKPWQVKQHDTTSPPDHYSNSYPTFFQCKITQ